MILHNESSLIAWAVGPSLRTKPLTLKSLRTLVCILVIVVWSIALGASPSFAQNIQHNETKADLGLRSDTRVDPSTLGMSFSIPLASYPGRAGHGLPVAITYSSKVLRLGFRGVDSPPITGLVIWTGVEFAKHSTAGWTSTLNPPRVEFTGMGQYYDGNGRAACQDVCVPGHTVIGNRYIKRINVYLPDGSSHELRFDDQVRTAPVTPFTGTFHAVDGSRMRFESNAGAASVLYLPDGSRYLFGPYNSGAELTATHFIDRNGNALTYNSGTRQWTDTLNRVITNPLPANPAANTETYFQANLVGGTSVVTYTFKWKYLADVLTPDSVTGVTPPLRYPGNNKCAPNSYPIVSPSLFISSFDTKVCTEQDQFGNPVLFNPVVLAEVVLPTGKFYRFTYNVYGEIDKILLTTGATDRFRYDQVAMLSISTAPYDQTNRGVVERRVSATGAAADESVWTYSVNSTNPYTVRTTRPDLSYSERLLHRSRYTQSGGPSGQFEFDDARIGIAYEERAYNSSGTMLRRGLSKWVEAGPIAGGHGNAARDPKVTKQVSILLDAAGNNALTATTVNRYEQASQPLNPTSTTQYGYDDSMSKTTAQTASVDSFNPPDSMAVRTTETAYLDDATYFARGLVALPTSVTIRSGMPGGAQRARTEISYDQLDSNHALLPCGATVGRADTGGGTARGNATSTGQWLNSTGVFLHTHTQYDECGSVRKIWDARDTSFSYPTQIEYSNLFQFAYATLTTSADPDGTGPLSALTASTEYDLSTGLVTATVDANSQRTTFAYNDPLNRLKQVIRASNDNEEKNQTTYNYDDTARTITVTSDLNIFNDNALKTVTEYDGLGRPKESRQYEGGANYIAVQTQYDAMGRGFKISNPFRPWQSETAVWTTSGFDALDRVLSVTTPDGAEVETVYSGDRVLVTDQAGKQRISKTDALGQLKDVWEVTAPDTATEPVSFPDHPEVTAGYRTSYSYDVLDNLLTVTQGSQTRTFAYDSLSRLTSAINPESGAISYQYDNNGNLTQKTDARVPAVTTTYVYDRLNRLTNRSYSDGTPAVTYNYDDAGVPNAKGRLTSVSSSVSSYSYDAYDALGRVLNSAQVTDGQLYSMEYGYDLAGNLRRQKYPSDRVVVTEYDTAGRVAGVKNESNEFFYAGATGTDESNRMQYTAHGAVKQMRLGNGLWEHSNFNTRLQVTQIGLGTLATNSSVLQLDYNYGTTANNGNLLSQSITIPGLTLNQSYTYDALNRLQTASENGGVSWKQKFLYDRYGNRRIDTAAANTSPDLIGPNPVLSETTNRIVAQPGEQYEYDGVGNLKRGREGQTYGFAAENKMTSFNGGASQGGADYIYDGDGRRVKKVVGNVTTVFVYNIMEQLIAEYSSAPPEFNGTRYFTSDHLGSPRVITNAGAAVVARRDYHPFGEEVGLRGGRSEQNGYVGDTIRQKFTQKERDVETGLDYFLARYRSPIQGRFISVDPDNAGVDLNFPQTWNGYSYALNSPLVFTDPDGQKVVICDLNGACTTLSDEDANKTTFSRKYQRKHGFSVHQGKIYDSNGSQIGTYQVLCCDWAANEATIRSLQDDRTWERAAVAAIWNYTVGRLLRSIFGGKTSTPTSSNTPGLPKSAPRPLGRGPTGRATPNNLKEQVAMEQAMSNPASGTQITRITMNDPRWPASQGWVKMRQNVNGVEIHYVRNTHTGEVDDFKFID